MSDIEDILRILEEDEHRPPTNENEKSSLSVYLNEQDLLPVNEQTILEQTSSQSSESFESDKTLKENKENSHQNFPKKRPLLRTEDQQLAKRQKIEVDNCDTKVCKVVLTRLSFSSSSKDKTEKSCLSIGDDEKEDNTVVQLPLKRRGRKKKRKVGVSKYELRTIEKEKIKLRTPLPLNKRRTKNELQLGINQSYGEELCKIKNHSEDNMEETETENISQKKSSFKSCSNKEKLKKVSWIDQINQNSSVSFESEAKELLGVSQTQSTKPVIFEKLENDKKDDVQFIEPLIPNDGVVNKMVVIQPVESSILPNDEIVNKMDAIQPVESLALPNDEVVNRMDSIQPIKPLILSNNEIINKKTWPVQMERKISYFQKGKIAKVKTDEEKKNVIFLQRSKIAKDRTDLLGNESDKDVEMLLVIKKEAEDVTNDADGSRNKETKKSKVDDENGIPIKLYDGLGKKHASEVPEAEDSKVNIEKKIFNQANSEEDSKKAELSRISKKAYAGETSKIKDVNNTDKFAQSNETEVLETDDSKNEIQILEENSSTSFPIKLPKKITFDDNIKESKFFNILQKNATKKVLDTMKTKLPNILEENKCLISPRTEIKVIGKDNTAPKEDDASEVLEIKNEEIELPSTSENKSEDLKICGTKVNQLSESSTSAMEIDESKTVNDVDELVLFLDSFTIGGAARPVPAILLKTEDQRVEIPIVPKKIETVEPSHALSLPKIKSITVLTVKHAATLGKSSFSSKTETSKTNENKENVVVEPKPSTSWGFGALSSGSTKYSSATVDTKFTHKKQFCLVSQNKIAVQLKPATFLKIEDATNKNEDDFLKKRQIYQVRKPSFSPSSEDSMEDDNINTNKRKGHNVSQKRGTAVKQKLATFLGINTEDQIDSAEVNSPRAEDLRAQDDHKNTNSDNLNHSPVVKVEAPEIEDAANKKEIIILDDSDESDIDEARGSQDSRVKKKKNVNSTDRPKPSTSLKIEAPKIRDVTNKKEIILIDLSDDSDIDEAREYPNSLDTEYSRTNGTSETRNNKNNVKLFKILEKKNDLSLRRTKSGKISHEIKEVPVAKTKRRRNSQINEIVQSEPLSSARTRPVKVKDDTKQNEAKSSDQNLSTTKTGKTFNIVENVPKETLQSFNGPSSS